MSNEYPVHVRREARRLWLSGQFTDEEVAAKLRIPRADTIRDWRQQEGWVEIARTLCGVIDERVKARVREDLGVFRERYDQLAQVIEARAVRALSNPNVSTRDLKQIAGTLAQTQRIRDKALGGDTGAAAQVFDNTVAAALQRARVRRAERNRGAGLGRCLGEGSIEGDPGSANQLNPG